MHTPLVSVMVPSSKSIGPIYIVYECRGSNRSYNTYVMASLDAISLFV